MTYNITIKGKGGHGSRPDLSYNPVDCFAAVYGALQGLDCRIHQVDGGNAVNVIPDTLCFVLECKNADADAVRAAIEQLCPIYRCTALFRQA